MFHAWLAGRFGENIVFAYSCSDVAPLKGAARGQPNDWPGTRREGTGMGMFDEVCRSLMVGWGLDVEGALAGFSESDRAVIREAFDQNLVELGDLQEKLAQAEDALECAREDAGGA